MNLTASNIQTISRAMNVWVMLSKIVGTTFLTFEQFFFDMKLLFQIKRPNDIVFMTDSELLVRRNKLINQ